ncbi:MAG: methylmalonyl-CoA epimerase [Chloroflexota bacterium]|mgnify:CR=1 FL=1|nr:methylmalonyl-CoA epimerase [Chloroflexota bacterium]
MIIGCPINHIDHVAIAVKDIYATLKVFVEIFGLSASEVSYLPEHGVKAVLIQAGQTRVEILEPLNPANAVGRFIETRGEGLHHIALNVTNLQDKLDYLNDNGFDLIDKVPREGLSGNVAFIHPRSVFGVLTELVEN